jgi:hypothetical protein
MNVRRPPVRLHIERLVVDGLPLSAAQGTGLQLALQRELGHLLAGRRAVDPPQREPLALVWDVTRPRALGRALAHQVFASLPGPGGGS